MSYHDSTTEAKWLNYLGSLFADARKSSRMSLKKISEETGISASHLLRMEKGEQDFTITKYCRLCEAMGIPAGLLLESVLFFYREMSPESELDMVGVKLATSIFGYDDYSKTVQIGVEIKWLIAFTCKAVQALWLSSNPPLIARQMGFHFGTVFQNLLAFSEQIDPLTSIAERISAIKSLNARPYIKLKSLGILNEQIIYEFIMERGAIELSSPGLYIRKFLMAEPDSAIHLATDFQEVAKLNLTSNSLKSNNAGVKSEIQKFIARVNRFASKPGAKAELARVLGVAPARITEWLSGTKEPGGAYTLQLLNWVEQQERQK